jgi:hypothetical protein
MGNTFGQLSGAVAKKILSVLYPDFEIVAYLMQIHRLVAKIERSAKGSSIAP